MTIIIYPQANSLIRHLKDFDIKDFEKWWNELPKVTPVGTSVVFQYLDMKDLGAWKDGRFIAPNQDTKEEIKKEEILRGRG